MLIQSLVTHTLQPACSGESQRHYFSFWNFPNAAIKDNCYHLYMFHDSNLLQELSKCDAQDSTQEMLYNEWTFLVLMVEYRNTISRGFCNIVHIWKYHETHAQRQGFLFFHACSIVIWLVKWYVKCCSNVYYCKVRDQTIRTCWPINNADLNA